MKKIIVNEYLDVNLVLEQETLSEYLSNDGEVLSGGAPLGWAPGYPQIANIAENTADFLFEGINIPVGTSGYFVIVPAGSTPSPSVNQIVAGQIRIPPAFYEYN